MAKRLRLSTRSQYILTWVVTLIVIMACVWVGRAYGMGSVRFGTYTQKYLDKQDQKRWKELCKGAGRYQAMAEAYDKHKKDPCQP